MSRFEMVQKLSVSLKNDGGLWEGTLFGSKRAVLMQCVYGSLVNFCCILLKRNLSPLIQSWILIA